MYEFNILYLQIEPYINNKLGIQGSTSSKYQDFLLLAMNI
jgi:hypothetical protein